ncbi:uncharacterized protein SEPMUDRAFT_119568 [Sphaerulina musiva SO2202]|uniref:Uncharacterized protein n=1 Tax=Sphaerulina musiva (strain SO2202) TaxID=692275 RepID=M3CBM3_SPHMS|nr:uncharacterized protein SEPMUDRAFT_119568 [Sphaerulina musiva SO2202]EMF09827.1 hypothetical protein SEPMUDRAFT_119568 [Sphaerulina musiva SO2202]
MRQFPQSANRPKTQHGATSKAASPQPRLRRTHERSFAPTRRFLAIRWLDRAVPLEPLDEVDSRSDGISATQPLHGLSAGGIGVWMMDLVDAIQATSAGGRGVDDPPFQGPPQRLKARARFGKRWRVYIVNQRRGTQKPQQDFVAEMDPLNRSPQ